MSGRTFAGPLMVALLLIDIGKSATLIISLKTFMESVIEKPKKDFRYTTICYSMFIGIKVLNSTQS